MILAPFLLLLFLFLCLWSYAFLHANDFSVPTKTIKKLSEDIRSVLVIFPHADDEALSTSGFLSRLSELGVKVDWLLLTKGERGNEHATFDEKLGQIRTTEAEQVAQIYGIRKLIQKEYPDYNVTTYTDKLKVELQKNIAEIRPDLILTYDLAGLYGHPDHIIVSELVTELVKKNFPKTKLWYVSFPRKILDVSPLPEYMAKDKNFKQRRMYPTCRVWVGFRGTVHKIRAAYTYKSQRQSYIKSFPVKILPLWFYGSLLPYEYFHEIEWRR